KTNNSAKTNNSVKTNNSIKTNNSAKTNNSNNPVKTITISSSTVKSKREPPPHAPQKERTNFGHKFPPQTVYTFNLYYAQLHFNRLLFIAQHNNLNVEEQTIIRQQFKKIGADLTAVRGSILGAVIKQSIIYKHMAPLIMGPVCMISSNVSDEENPKL
ncbi:11348_t:CDS:1, partial [Dentiscutata erythropus]